MVGSSCHRYRKVGIRLRSSPGRLNGNSPPCSGTLGVERTTTGAIAGPMVEGDVHLLAAGDLAASSMASFR